MASLDPFVHPESFRGFRVLPVCLRATSRACHQIFFKAHQVDVPCLEKPLGRTLFLVNVPPWATPSSLRRVWAVNGAVSHVFCQRQPSPGTPPPASPSWGGGVGHAPNTRVGGSFKYAYVVFSQPSALAQALRRMDLSRPRPLADATHPIALGLAQWRSEYNRSIVSDGPALMADLERTVADLDRAQKVQVQQAQAQAQPDEEGWITVSRHAGRRPVLRNTEHAHRKLKTREARKRKRKELAHFYQFQVKESKLQRLDELRSQFEGDKLKLNALKVNRKFRPNQ